MPGRRWARVFGAAFALCALSVALLSALCQTPRTKASHDEDALPVSAEATAEPFDPTRDSGILDLVDPGDRETLSEALVDAGRNWPELADALETLEQEQREACLHLIRLMPHLDRLEMTSTTLVEHVRYAFRARGEMPYGVPDEMFEPYILTYRIEEEPVTPWRSELYRRFAPVAEREGSVRATARAVNAELASALEEREREFYGPRQSPLLTLRSGSGSQAEIAILACAVLKSVAIPSRQAGVSKLGGENGGAHWIEFFDGEAWIPLFPLEPAALGDFGYIEAQHENNVTVVSTRSSFERVLVTEEYTETGTVEFAFVNGGAPAAGFEHFSLAVLNEGGPTALDDLDAVAGDDGRFEAIVGEGRYVAMAGVRNSEGDPFVMMQDVVVRPGGRVALAFDVTPRGESALPALESLRRLGRVLTVVVLLDPVGEPSLRMLPLIAGEVQRRGGAVRLVCVYRAEGDLPREVQSLLGSEVEIVNLSPNDRLFEDHTGFQLAFPDDRDRLPVVLAYATETGSEILRHSGYDLNIARRLEASLDAKLSELLE